MPILDDVARYHEELRAIRQDIHANPELGLEEYRTADLVAAKLEEWGIEVHRGVGGTGVVGVLRSGNGPGAIGSARGYGRTANRRSYQRPLQQPK